VAHLVSYTPDNNGTKTIKREAGMDSQLFQRKTRKIVPSDHSLARIQQRGINPAVFDLLLQYGAKEYDRMGGKILFFNHRSRLRIQRELGDQALALVEKSAKLYAVVSKDNSLITVGHRYRRIWRDRPPFHPHPGF